MIRVYTIDHGKISQSKNPTSKEIGTMQNIIWIDLQSPTKEEKEFVEKNYGIEFSRRRSYRKSKVARAFSRLTRPLK
jgi:Mg2+ and Co2+ transporter CorA